MEIKKTVAWIGVLGAAALTTALFAVLMAQNEEAPLQPAAEPNLFAFIKPMNDVAAKDAAKPAPEIRHHKPHGGTADDQASLYAMEQPALREVPDATMKIATVQESAQKMRSQGASEDDIYRMRAAELSADAADQLAGLDRRESAWKNRVAAYLAERESLLNGNENAAGINPQEALQQLRNTRFTSDEQKLLANYEQANVPLLKMD